MDESALTSTQPSDYSNACRMCAMGLSLAAGPLAGVGDQAIGGVKDLGRGLAGRFGR